MTKFMIHLWKDVHAWYEVDSADAAAAAVQRLEQEKLRSYEYEKSLDLEWELETCQPDIIGIDQVPSDEAA
jgi:hypothetical protein